MSTTKNLESPGHTVIDNETQTVAYEVRSPALLLAEANRHYTGATELVVDSEFMFEEGSTMLRVVVGAKKTLDEERLASGAPLRQRLGEINDGYTPAINLYANGEKVLKGLLTSYAVKIEMERLRLQRIADAAAAEQRRLADVEAERVRRVAAKAAEALQLAAKAESDERQRIADAAAAEQRRLANEAIEAGDTDAAAVLNEKAESITATAATTTQMILAHGDQSANDAMESGESEASSFQFASSMATPAVVQMSRPRAAGIGLGKKYTGVVNDPKALMTFVLANYEHFSHFFEINQGAVNRYAADQKDRLSLPGVELHAETKMSSRRA